jgi:hypothetical protein
MLSSNLAIHPRLTQSEVLVAMLHRILFGHDHLESVDRTVPPPRYSQAHPQMDHLRRHGHISLHWRSLLLRDALPVYSDQLLLEQARARILRSHRRNHWPHFPLQCLCDHLGFHFRHPSYLLDLGSQHACEDKDDAYSCPWNGLRVSWQKDFL